MGWRFTSKRRSLVRATIVASAVLILLVLSMVAVSNPAPTIDQALKKLPPPQPHSLPPTLAQWQDPKQAGNYFDQIQTPIVGALVWSTLPVTVYIQPKTDGDQTSPFLQNRAANWIGAVQTAVQEWNRFLPLQTVDQPGNADIRIWRSTPPLKLEPASNQTGDRRLLIPRARSAEATFELYAKPSSQNQSPRLAHRMTIHIRPDQAIEYLQATARHELGHALGIWGHSPYQTDALYFSQVRHPAKISPRDINTLKLIYQQPTRLGWALQE